jgi:hypothetical protein
VKDRDEYEFRNALPDEVDDHPDSGMPRQLRTQADKEAPLSEREAEVSGLVPGFGPIYGESSFHETDDDRRDIEHADEGEHL